MKVSDLKLKMLKGKKKKMNMQSAANALSNEMLGQSFWDSVTQFSYINSSNNTPFVIDNNAVEKATLEAKVEEVKPPEGYRMLNDYERIKYGDLYYNKYAHFKDSPWIKLRENECNNNPIFTKVGWGYVCRPIISVPIYGEKEINYLIELLKSKKAFNEDSAMQLEGKNELICLDLCKKGIIKCFNGYKFFINKSS